jgi:hypothetical protein
MPFDFTQFGGTYQQQTNKIAAYSASVDDDLIKANATDGAFTVTLPTAIGNGGKMIGVQKTDSSANVVTVAATAGSIYGNAKLTAQYQVVFYTSDGTNWYEMQGWNGEKKGASVVASADPYVIDPTAGDFHTITPGVTGNVNAGAAGAVGQRMTLFITSYTLTFNTNFKSTGTLATGTTSAKVFILEFVSNGTTWAEVSRTTAQ